MAGSGRSKHTNECKNVYYKIPEGQPEVTYSTQYYIFVSVVTVFEYEGVPYSTSESAFQLVYREE